MFWGFLRNSWILENLDLCSKVRFSAQMSNNAKIPWNTRKAPPKHVLILNNLQAMVRCLGQPTLQCVYNFADYLHWPELGMLLESIDYHEAARKASFLGSMCEDPLMAAIHFERRFDALMKYVINSQDHPIGKVKDFFYRVEFPIIGSCYYLVTTYFFWIENIPQDISDVLVQYIDSVIKTDIPDEPDVELCQLVKRLQTHSHSKYFQKTPPSSGRFKFPFALQII